jgi:hypothetical protein
MRLKAEPSEVATLVYEDNAQTKKIIRFLHGFMQKSDCREIVGDKLAENLPLRKIVDTAHFSEKLYCAPLQLADVCAYVIRKHVQKDADNERFFGALSDKLIMRPIVMNSQARSGAAIL